MIVIRVLRPFRQFNKGELVGVPPGLLHRLPVDAYELYGEYKATKEAERRKNRKNPKKVKVGKD